MQIPLLAVASFGGIPVGVNRRSATLAQRPQEPTRQAERFDTGSTSFNLLEGRPAFNSPSR
jgi:hypothetical protein